MSASTGIDGDAGRAGRARIRRARAGRSAVRTRSAISCAFSASVPGRIRANSSPPVRAAMSAAAHRLAKLRTNPLEDAIPERMTVELVDRLEVVEVEGDQRHRARASPPPSRSSLRSACWKPRWLIRPVSGSVSTRSRSCGLLAVEQHGQREGEQHPDPGEDGQPGRSSAIASPMTVPQMHRESQGSPRQHPAVGISGMGKSPHGRMYRNTRPGPTSLFFGQIACLDA